MPSCQDILRIRRSGLFQEARLRFADQVIPRDDALSGSTERWSVEDDAGMHVWEMFITVRCQQSTEQNVKRLR